MDLQLYLNTLRRRWRLIAGAPLLVLLISGGAGLAQPARYATRMRLLVTRDAQAPGTAGQSDRAEDTTAQDLPAIIQSSVFHADLAAELARRGQPLGAEALAGALAAEFSEHTVSISAQAGTPAAAAVLADSVLALLRANGLRYWGASPAAGQPGLNIGMLDPPAPPAQINGPRALALQLALRALLGVGAAAGLALLPLAARPTQGR